MKIRTPVLLAILAAVALCLTTLPAAAVAAPTESGAQPNSTEGTADLQTQPLPAAVPEDYRIAQEDILKIDVWGEKQLSDLQCQVTPDGKIDVAFIGGVQAEGLTIHQLTEALKKRFEDEQIIADAKIQITLLNMHQPTARVLGEVNKPGTVVFKDGDTIMDAIAQAGSYTQNAWLENATLTHKNSDTPIPINLRKMFNGDTTVNYPLQKGDTIYIPPEDYENKIYVLGYVMRPGIYSLKENTTVLSAISLAGGPNERGALRGTTVVRGDPAKPERVACDLTRLFDKADLSQDVTLKPGDVVIVPETRKPNWSSISSILGTILNLTYIRRYGLF